MTGRSRLEPELEERDPKRVIAFTDGVIAISVTLLVLDIHAPESTAHLPQDLLALWPSYLSYVITFMLVGQVWANHHVMFDHIRHADRMVLFLNATLLMDIAILPFAAAVLARALHNGNRQGERTAVLVHGIAFEFAVLLFNAIWWYARHDRRLLADTIDDAGVKALSKRFQLAFVWIGAATVLGALVLPGLGVAAIASFIAYYWLPISGRIGGARRGADPAGRQEQPPGADESSRDDRSDPEQ